MQGDWHEIANFSNLNAFRVKEFLEESYNEDSSKNL